MSESIDTRMLDDIDREFTELAKTQKVMKDGALCIERYVNAKPRIMWVLKQNIDYDCDDYKEFFRQHMGTIASSPTWRRMAYVSYGLLSGERDTSKLRDAHAGAECLLQAAIVEVDKELGGAQSPDTVIRDGFDRHKQLVFRQMDAYKPDLIIICLPEALKDVVNQLYRHCHRSDFAFRLPNEIICGADVAIGMHSKPLMLWTYHPQATKGGNGKGIKDEAYTTSLLNAYDRAMRLEMQSESDKQPRP